VAKTEADTKGKTESKPGEYFCATCNLYFKTAQALGSHIAYKHPEQKPPQRRKISITQETLSEILSMEGLMGQVATSPEVRKAVAAAHEKKLNAEIALTMASIDLLERAKECGAVLTLLQKRLVEVLDEDRIAKTTSVDNLLKWLSILSKMVVSWIKLSHAINVKTGDSDQHDRLLRLAQSSTASLSLTMQSVSAVQERKLVQMGLPPGTTPAEKVKALAAIDELLSTKGIGPGGRKPKAE